MTQNEFTKPTDEWIEEPKEVEYEAVVIGEDGKPKKEKVKYIEYEKVKYIKAPKAFFSCANGKHNYFMFDRERHIAKCKNCSRHKFLFASSQTIKDGKIVDRFSGQVFD